MKKRSLLIAVLVFLTINFTVMAQDEDEERDIVEMSAFGGLGVPSSGLTDWETGGMKRAAKTGFDFGLEAGYFLSSELVVGIGFTYTQFPIDDSDEQSDHKHHLYNPNLYVKYLFEGESNWVPYVKGHVGIENPKFSTFATNVSGNRFRELSYDPALALGAGLGVFYYTADYSGIFLEVNYHRAFTEDVEASYQHVDYKFGENLSLFDIHVGIRILFGSGG